MRLTIKVFLWLTLMGVGLLGCRHVSRLDDEWTGAKNNAQAVLGEGDVVEVHVFDELELSGTHQISSNGTVRLPLVGSLKISGLTPEAAAGCISEALQKGYLREPHVSVFVKEFNSRKVFVLGQVKTPGPYAFEENMTVIGAVAKAGGTSATAAANRTVVTRTKNGQQVRYISKVADIGRGEAKDIELQPGDIVFVPESLF